MNPNNKKVFISYVRENSGEVDRICTAFAENNIDYWIDRKEIEGGSFWKTAIRKAINNGRYFLACFSNESVEKTETHMNEEILLAIGILRKKPFNSGWFVPIKLNSCNIPDHEIGGGKNLQDIHYLDFEKDWDENISKLVGIIKPIVDKNEDGNSGRSDFRFYRLGNLELPIMNLIGLPNSPFKMSEVEIEVLPYRGDNKLETMPLFHEREEFPANIRKAIEWLKKKVIDDGEWKEENTNNRLPRVVNISQGGEGQDDSRGKLYIKFSVTDFLTYFATNRSLDDVELPQSIFGRKTTLRQELVRFPYDLKRSYLSNPLSAHMILVSESPHQHPELQVIVQWRDGTAFYNKKYTSSSAGYIAISHKDGDGNPSPFVTATIEARQEINDDIDNKVLSPSDYKMIGISLNWEDMDLNAFGFSLTNIPADELISGWRRDKEGELEAIPFDPKSVITHISNNKWEPMGAFALISTLFHFYKSREIKAIAKNVFPKVSSDFLEKRTE